MIFTSARRCSILVFLAALGMGCGANGLIRTMDEYRFIALSPPQSSWVPGSIIEVKANEPNAPALRCFPSDAGANIEPLKSVGSAPELSTKHDEKFDLALGVSAPAKVKAELAAKGAVSYSVVASENSIVRISIDPYLRNVFPKIRDEFGGNWATPIDNQELYYIYELWFATKLEYKFYNSGGVSVKLSVPVKTVDANLSAGWSSTDDGSLIYDAGSDPAKRICLGYKKRPIVWKANAPGVIVAMGSRIEPLGNEARVEPHKKKPPQ
ncbi:MAG: hypothetical protein HY293_22155 [Planctomycetes bacterium]|nr:hypothetical protein [Planctomycetota bacterium]